MSRTTLDIDDPVLRDLKKLQRAEGKSLGRLVSDLLADALGRLKAPPPAPAFHWHARVMQPLVDIADKDAVQAILDRDQAEKLSR